MGSHTKTLNKHKKLVRKLFYRAQKTQLQQDWVNMLRNLAWKKFSDEQQCFTAVYRANKALLNDPTARLDLVQKPDGAYTQSLEESLRVMVDTHKGATSFII